MKINKTISKLITVCIASFAIIFSSCHGYVFSNIMEDVPPEEATVNGPINSITRYKPTASSQDYLVTYSQQGLIYKNQNNSSHGQWNVCSNLPFELHYYDYYSSKHIGQQIIKTVADDEYLYVVTVSYKNDVQLGFNAPEMFYIWAAKITDWNGNINWVKIVNQDFSYTDGSYYYTNFNVFCTNAPQRNHRKAYIRINDSNIYQLAGTTTNNIASPNRYSEEPYGNGKIDSVVYFNNDYYFLDAIAVTTNETVSQDATYMYFARDNSENIYYVTTSMNPTFALAAGDEVSCLAVTKDSLLIGRSDIESLSGSYGGIVKSVVNNWIPEDKLTLFTTNAASQMPSSYLINTLLVLDSSKNETQTDIYATICFRASASSSSVNFENVGLWSYYPSRGNWNRE